MRMAFWHPATENGQCHPMPAGSNGGSTMVRCADGVRQSSLDDLGVRTARVESLPEKQEIIGRRSTPAGAPNCQSGRAGQRDRPDGTLVLREADRAGRPHDLGSEPGANARGCRLREPGAAAPSGKPERRSAAFHTPGRTKVADGEGGGLRLVMSRVKWWRLCAP